MMKGLQLQSVFAVKITPDFPGGPVAKNSPSNTGDGGSIPGRGTKIPHAVGQLSLGTTTTRNTTTEPTCPGARVPQLEKENPHTTTREKPAHHNEEPAPQ